MNLYYECALFLVGLAFGSFLNVCITRIPRDESIVRPGSHCRQCGAPIRWRDNIPIVSFMLLRGRCRDCGMSIPYRCPLVELLTAVVFAACYQWFGVTWLTLKFCVFGFLLIGLIFMDAETGLLPHEFTYPGIVLGLAFAWVVPGDASGTWLLLLAFHKHIASVRALSLLDSVIGALVGAGFFYVTWGLYYLVRKRHGLGFGDIALIAMTGAFLGLKLNLFVIFCGPLATFVYVFLLLVREALRPRGQKHADAEEAASEQLQPDHAAADHDQPPPEHGEPPFLQRELPFGVFLGASALVAIFFGEAAWAWYLGQFHRSLLSAWPVPSLCLHLAKGARILPAVVTRR